MKKIKLILSVAIGVCMSTCYSQNVVENFELPSQTFIKFNKNFINPSLSLFNNSSAEIILNHRQQWSAISDAPKTYLLAFNGNNFEKRGYGLSVYQKNVGVWKSTGIIGNYAKGIRLSENTILGLGFNVTGFTSDLDRTRITTTEADPLLNQYEKTNLVLLNPGISIQINKFNIGIYGDNLVDYNFTSSKIQTPFTNKTYSGHLMYQSPKSEDDNLFEDSNFTFLTRVKYTKNIDLEYTGGLLYNLPKAGWASGSYNSLYGVSVGVGFNLISKIAIGYNYEKGIKDQITNLGQTHEFYLAYSFGNNDEKLAYNEKPTKKVFNKSKSLEEEEIRRYKKKVYNKDVALDNKIAKEKIETFKKIADKEEINYLILPEKSGALKKGYYLITNVYSDKATAEKKMEDLRNSGLRKSSFFVTLSGEWNYVFLERYDSVEDAKKAYSSQYNNRYKDIIWILPIL
jgi:type IX secretion system PorP/SprF family membrane protein